MSQRRLFVGNLPFKTEERDLRKLFEQIGPIISLRMPMERDTNRFRGFAFIEYSTEAEAQAAIDHLHETEVGGRTIVVNLAKPEISRAQHHAQHHAQRDDRRDRRERREARW